MPGQRQEAGRTVGVTAPSGPTSAAARPFPSYPAVCHSRCSVTAQSSWKKSVASGTAVNVRTSRAARAGYPPVPPGVAVPVRYALVMVSLIWPLAASVAVTLSVTKLSAGAVYDAW
jgi:hypothetical protein